MSFMEIGKLDEKRIREGIGCETDVTVFDEIDSTSTEARRRVQTGLDRPMLILSESQTAGRGRIGHSFYSPKYEGIYMTLVCPESGPGDELFRVTAKAAVAVYRGVKASTGISLGIKWVNDLYLGKEKAAGILTECVAAGEKRCLLVGIGINVTTSQFPEDIAGKAGALRPGEDTDRNEIVIAVVRALLEELKKPEDVSYLETYRRESIVIGREILYGEGKSGTATGIDDEGRLLVRTAGGSEERLNSGEIRIRIIDQ